MAKRHSWLAMLSFAMSLRMSRPQFPAHRDGYQHLLLYCSIAGSRLLLRPRNYSREISQQYTGLRDDISDFGTFNVAATPPTLRATSSFIASHERLHVDAHATARSHDSLLYT